ncbi:hypothetical protein T440DRAFT_465515 [Plenodomus tracheiphilus IPT5]|uniref:Uncharacterized protein n=1 Tax=Plenodomus tracheiphilus IPT5 TaxID=1408161 RepID=A0A6A7BEC5_9PLEO|nr:hypothetical protein T440DRAFT_465515 [Plenodomus tracheiphilus IPT5]
MAFAVSFLVGMCHRLHDAGDAVHREHDRFTQYHFTCAFEAWAVTHTQTSLRASLTPWPEVRPSNHPSIPRPLLLLTVRLQHYSYSPPAQLPMVRSSLAGPTSPTALGPRNER